MAYEHRVDTGTIFPNRYKEDGDNKPYKAGELKLGEWAIKCIEEGIPIRLAIWERVTNDGRVWESIKADPPRQQAPAADDDDSSIPF